MDLGAESLNFSNVPNTEKQINFILRWLLGYLFYIPATFLSAVWMPHDQPLAIIEETVSL